MRAQWRALGPFGGSAALVQVDPHVSKTVIAGTANALLYRSQDGGETWNAIAFPVQLRATLQALSINPRIPGLYFAGVSAESPGNPGLWRSKDGGESWEGLAAFRGLEVRSIAVFRGNAQLMAAGTNKGVLQSQDAGNSWKFITRDDSGEIQPVVSIAFDSKDPNTIYAGTPHLPWKTSDAGATWESIHDGMIDDSDVFSILVDRNRPQRVFASACSGLYRSMNGGSTWSKLPGAKDASFRTYSIVQDPQFENILYAGTTHGMVRSPDGGTTWQKIAPYATRSITFDLRRLGRIFIATDDAGILRSDNGGRTWQTVNRGFCNRNLAPLAVTDRGAVYTSTPYGEGDGGVFRLADQADEWSKVASAENIVALAPVPGSRGRLLGLTSRSVLLSRDAGSTWTRLPTPREWTSLSGLFAVPSVEGGMIAINEHTAFVSGDFGRTWKKLRAEAPTSIKSLTALDPPWIAAIGESDLFLSADGESWRPCAGFAGSPVLHGVAALGGNRLLTATSAGLRISSDDGASWQPAGGALGSETIQAVARHPVRNSMVFAARYGLIYASVDSGASWVTISPEKWAVDSVKQMIVVPGNPDRLLVLTQRQGVFELRLDVESETHPTR